MYLFIYPSQGHFLGSLTSFLHIMFHMYFENAAWPLAARLKDRSSSSLTSKIPFSGVLSFFPRSRSHPGVAVAFPRVFLSVALAPLDLWVSASI